MASSESNVGKEILFHSPTTTMSICDTTKSLYIKRFRPLMPKPPAAVSQTHFSAINAQRADFSMDAAPMDKQIPAQNRLLYIGLSSGREPGSGHGASPQAVSSRWNPTADQLRILEDLYARGIRTPSAEQIQYITVQLRCYGKIEGKNVFYWFQNHKARERQKRRRRMGMSAEDPLKSASETTSKQAYRPTHDTNVAWSAARTNPWPFSTSPHLEKTAFMQEPAAGKNFLKLAVPSADEEEDCRLNINCTSFSERDLNAKCTANKKDVVTLQQKLGMMNRQEDYSINLQNLQPVQDSHHQISTNWIRVLDSGDQADRRIFTSEQIWPRNCSIPLMMKYFNFLID